MLPVSNVWKTFCQAGENLALHAAAGYQLKRLAEPELDLFQLLIKCRPSRTYKGIKENIEVQSMATASRFLRFLQRGEEQNREEGEMVQTKSGGGRNRGEIREEGEKKVEF